MKKSMLMLAVCVTVAVAVFLTGCPNPAGGGNGGSSTGGSSTGGGSKGGDSAYIASAELTDFLRSVLGELDKSSSSGDTPDTFVIDATDFSSKKDFDIMLKVGLVGKNVIIDAPTKDELKGLAAAIKSYLSGNEDLSAEYDAAEFNSLEFLAAQFEGLSGSEKAYEAVGLRDMQIYYVHRFDEVLGGIEHSDPDDSSPNIRSAGASENISAASRAANDDDIEAFAAKKFAEWISKVNDADSNARYMSSKDVAGFRAAGNVPDIDKLAKAQSFYHSWTACSHRLYGDRKELVEVVVDVWARCNMDTQEDFYLVHHRVAANNDQLGYNRSNNSGPFMYKGVVSQTVLNLSTDKMEVRDLSPKTTTGKLSFTTGSSLTITGQVGMAVTGPSLGLSVGETLSKSSTTDIPAIKITQSLNKDSRGRYTEPVLTFEAPPLGPYSPTDIQIKRAVFDTYAVFMTESSVEDIYNPYYYMPLHISDEVQIGHRDTDDRGKRWIYWIDREHNFRDYVHRPSNVKKNYIMSFTSPASYSIQDRTALRDAVKKFNHFWGENVPYYAAGGEKSLEMVAKNYFKKAMNVVKKNKNVLQDAGFKGNFKFYIQDPEKGTQLATEDVDFQ